MGFTSVRTSTSPRVSHAGWCIHSHRLSDEGTQGSKSPPPREGTGAHRYPQNVHTPLALPGQGHTCTHGESCLMLSRSYTADTCLHTPWSHADSHNHPRGIVSKTNTQTGS